MKKRSLGKMGPEVSAMGIGAMSFCDFYGQTTDENSHRILSAALDAGITHIDTANVYGLGRSENTIGQFLKDNYEAREHFTIATKASVTVDDEGNRCFRNTFEHLESELDKSLQRLGTDCVDLFYVHRRQAEIAIEEVAGNLQRLKEKGKTRGIGFSEIAPSSLRRASNECHIDAVQSEYSLSVRSPEMGLVQTCAELGTALVAFSPVGRSFLTDNPLSMESVNEIGGFVANNPRFKEPNYSANIAATEPFRSLAAELEVSTAGLAIAWVLAQGDHVIAIPGTRSINHFNELLEGWNLKLTSEILEGIEKILPLGWAHGDRYSASQWIGPERYC